jgi:hypothetical protein
MIFQAGVVSKWTNDSQRFLLEHFDTIKNSPSHIYHSALPFSPSSSWLHKCYSTEISLTVKVVKGLPAEWGMCSRTVLLTAGHKPSHAGKHYCSWVSEHRDIIILDAITGSQTAVLSGHTDWVNCLLPSHQMGLHLYLEVMTNCQALGCTDWWGCQDLLWPH